MDKQSKNSRQDSQILNTCFFVFRQEMELSELLAKSYANEMYKKYYTIRASLCDGCKFGLLSQNDHSLCFLDLKGQISYMFDFLLDEIQDEGVMSNFELLLADKGMNLGDIPYQYSNIFWRKGVFNHEFVPGLKHKTVFFLSQKLKRALED